MSTYSYSPPHDAINIVYRKEKNELLHLSLNDTDINSKDRYGRTPLLLTVERDFWNGR